MLLTLLHSIALLGAAAPAAPANAIQVPTGALALPSAIRTADVPAQVQMTGTHFLATSLVNEPQWIIFSNADRSLVHVRGLRPFERALMPIPKGGAEGISLELIMRSLDGTLLTSGIFSCEQVEAAPSGVFIERTETTLLSWTPRHGGRSLTRLATKGSVLGPTLASSPARPRAAHVPVPVPAENRTKDKSRKLEKKKLPVI